MEVEISELLRCVPVCVCSKQTVESDAKYRFLRGLVANVADIHTADHDDADVNQQQQTREVRPRGRCVVCRFCVDQC